MLPTRAGELYVIDWDNWGLAGVGQGGRAGAVRVHGRLAGAARELYDAYVGAGGPGRVERPGDFSMVIAQIGHIGESAIATWLDPGTSAAERERQVPRIEEFVTVAVTRDVIAGVPARSPITPRAG